MRRGTLALGPLRVTNSLELDRRRPAELVCFAPRKLTELLASASSVGPVPLRDLSTYSILLPQKVGLLDYFIGTDKQ